LSTEPQNKDLKRLVRARMAETGENYTQALTALLGEASELHTAMVDQIAAELGADLPEPVAAALRRVPRHLFTPGVPVARAYADIHTSIVTRRSERGTALSSVSAPWIVAGMLTQLDVRPGQSVLEIGSGGYQAALLQELVGPAGSVTTLDIDPEVIARARACLDLAGYDDVRIICADGEHGAPGHGPFDKIIIAAQAWDIPPAWPQSNRGESPGHGVGITVRVSSELVGEVAATAWAAKAVGRALVLQGGHQVAGGHAADRVDEHAGVIGGGSVGPGLADHVQQR
jgi:protein-L-isoaspartate(D-aspartate) O-methyltransferase